MKYWRGYLVAAFLAIATFAITQFAAGHRLLVDMVYPYMVRMLLPEVTAWSSSVDFCLWQTLLLFVIGGVVLSIILMVLFRWNPVQWFGWILALSCLFSLQYMLFSFICSVLTLPIPKGRGFLLPATT